MSKFEKLAQINKIANECINDGDYVLASKFHNKFMKIAQKTESILISRIAKGMGLTPDISDAELMANIVRICDYIKPERLRDPSQPPSPNNVMLRDLPGATPKNSYDNSYWHHCQESFNSVTSSTMLGNFHNKCDYLRKAARAEPPNLEAIMAVFSQS